MLAELDLLAGLYLRETLHGLRLDQERWRLVDLEPPQTSRRINRSGRTLTVTPELLISSTTGISTPLGGPATVAQYLDEGATGKLRRRLERDVKAIFPEVRPARPPADGGGKQLGTEVHKQAPIASRVGGEGEHARHPLVGAIKKRVSFRA